MGKNCMDWITHDFYCICCGAKGIPLQRAGNKLKVKNHRKNMYCYRCKRTVNHVECRNMYEVEQFKEDYVNGVYEDEARAELEYEAENPRLSTLCDVRGSGVW